MPTDLPVLKPDWPAPASVRALSTTRLGGVSDAPWDSLNLGSHVADDELHVMANRRLLASHAGLEPAQIHWLEQVHGNHVHRADGASRIETPCADACMTVTPNQACAILTADCLPVLLCDVSGTRVGAAHAGWRGLSGGVLEALVACLSPAHELMAWLGPAIGPRHFEVGPEVRETFVASYPDAGQAFTVSGDRPGHYLADLWELARQRLRRAGVTQIYGGGICTVSDPARFFSYRRDGKTGRMATLIWLT
ncbi:peptidoglycan editing factor PgeF [Marinobacter salicampi]|uniref:peptidoglycan editing factor PgeF n=1 Tax=Marinobacter salicampi TaxID=435907 RepID=UPI0014075AB5|nr:peptidoglycan editing factor PgeF [Marinobacter salicampi]